MSDEELRQRLFTALSEAFPETVFDEYWNRWLELRHDFMGDAMRLINTYAKDRTEKLIGDDEDLNAPAETYGPNDQSLGDNPAPNPDLQYVVRRATRNVFRTELRERNTR